jgi:hypothetical protein
LKHCRPWQNLWSIWLGDQSLTSPQRFLKDLGDCLLEILNHRAKRLKTNRKLNLARLSPRALTNDRFVMIRVAVPCLI